MARVVLLFVLGAGAAVGSVIGLLARRWPAVAAPRISGETITAEVRIHPRLAQHLRHHYNPKTETGLALTAASALVIAAAVGVGLLLAIVRSRSGAGSVDRRLAQYAADHATNFSTDVMRVLTEIGSSRWAFVLAVIATVIGYLQRPSRSIPLFMTLVFGGQMLLANGIKLLVERVRPDISRLGTHGGTSFPSGHTTAAAATLAAIALISTLGRSRRAKVAAASLAAGLAAVVAGTRVFLGVHWFTDVLAGLLLGWGWFAVCSIAFGGRMLNFGVAVAAAEGVAATGSATGTVSSEPHARR